MDTATNPIDRLHGYYFEDLEEGMEDVFAKTITDADITNFAGMSGDTNPVHLNHEFAIVVSVCSVPTEKSIAVALLALAPPRV